MRYTYLSILFLFLVSCEGILNLEIVGDGNLVSSERVNLAGFGEIEFYDAFELEIRQWDQAGQKVTVLADSNLIRYITTVVNDDRLTIQRLPNYDLFPRKPIRVIVHTNHVRTIDVYGNGLVFVDSMTIDKLDLNVFSRATVRMSGLMIDGFSILSNSGGTIHLDGQFDQILIRQAGSGQTSIRGAALSAEIIQEGSGIIETKTFFANNSAVSLFGSGLIYYNSVDKSSVSIDGSGRIFYWGTKPESIIIKGSGRLYDNGQ